MRKILIKTQKIGALTSKPYSFKSRPWELKTLNSIDLYDTLGSNIKINYKGSNILRVTPGINEYINEEWISDKIRFSYDNLYRWRYTVPLIKKNNKYQIFSWSQALEALERMVIDFQIKHYKIYSGNYSSLETLTIAKNLFINQKNCELKPLTYIKNNDNFLNKNISLLDINSIKSNKIYFLIGSNLRVENPILNLKFRKLSKKKKILIFNIGNSYDTTCYMQHIGNNLNCLNKVIRGKHYICKIITKFISKNNTLNLTFYNKLNVLIGGNTLNRFDINNIINLLNLLPINKKLILLYTNVGSLTSNFINFQNRNLTKNDNFTLYYFLNTEVQFNKYKKNCLLLFQGHHNFSLQNVFDIILPSNTFFETKGLYINCLNILQLTKGINPFFKETKDDWKILIMVGKKVFNFNFKYLKQENLLSYIKKNFGLKYLDKNNTTLHYLCFLKNNKKICFNKTTIKNNIFNYHINDSLTKASKNMQKCSNIFFKNKHSYLWN